MNNLLQKCLEELAKESPKLDYVRGILETVIALGDSSTVEQAVVNRKVEGSNPPPPAKQDEASLLDAQAKAMIAQIPPQPQEI